MEKWGILGAVLIILLAVSVTVCTGLSLSSVTTNIRIGSGGAFSIISKTLGLEIGGSVGIPLYIAQTLSVALYVFGFSEAFLFFMPEAPLILVLMGAFAALFLLTFVDIKYAIKAQIIVFGLIIIVLFVVLIGGNWWETTTPHLIESNISIPSIWFLFALFFPAVTGLMSGVGLSGELTNPKKQIPKGLIYALGITTVIYIIMAFWLGYSASPEMLSSNNLIMVELSAFPTLVIIGILAATFSSALTTLVAAPRLLQALAENSAFVFNDFFMKKTPKGEPKNAMIFTSILVLGTLTVGNLDLIAPLLTMFFLLTYSIINLVVLIEQNIGLVSFRPTFKIPKIVPLYGTLASLVIMLYINIVAGIVSMALAVIIYMFLVRKKLDPKEGYVRSGLLAEFSEWSARKVDALSESKEHTWKPNILLPVTNSKTLLSTFPLIKSIIYPHGNISVLGMNLPGKKSHEKKEEELKVVKGLVNKFKSEKIFASYSHIDADEYIEDSCVALQAMEGQFFHPNILFIPSTRKDLPKKDLERLFHTVKEVEAGFAIFQKDPLVSLGAEKDIHVWLPDSVIEKDFYEERPFDLSMLIAYRLWDNWKGKMTLWMPTKKKKVDEAKSYLNKLVYESRFPDSTKTNVVESTLLKGIKDSPKGDIHIIPVSNIEEFKKIFKSAKKMDRSFLFVFDSTTVDVLA